MDKLFNYIKFHFENTRLIGGGKALFSKDNLLNMGFEGFIRLKNIGNNYSIFSDCKGLYYIY